MKPNILEALVKAGGPERFVRDAAEQAIQAERQYWLAALEKKLSPKGRKMAMQHAGYVRDLRRRLGVGRSTERRARADARSGSATSSAWRLGRAKGRQVVRTGWLY